MASEVQRCIAVPCHLELRTLEGVQMYFVGDTLFDW